MSRQRWRDKPENRDRYLAAQRRANARSKDKRRDFYLQRRYGISSADYDRMFTEQNGRCAICQDLHENSARPFDVDHDHATGVVRGLLCGRCNKRLAVLEDAEFRTAAEEYLATHAVV